MGKLDFLTVFQDSVIEIASKRLGRPLTEREISGVRLVESCLMLEAYEREFDWPATTPESIETNLERMACQTKPFRI